MLRNNLPLLAPLPPILANTIVVPLVLRFGYSVNLPIPFMMLTVGIGEILSCGVLGIILYAALRRYKNLRSSPEIIRNCLKMKFLIFRQFLLSYICVSASRRHLIHLPNRSSSAFPAVCININHAAFYISYQNDRPLCI